MVKTRVDGWLFTVSELGPGSKWGLIEGSNSGTVTKVEVTDVALRGLIRCSVDFTLGTLCL